MFKQISEDEVKEFFELIGEIECGSHIDFENNIHVNWLNKKIKSNINNGVEYFSFIENGQKAGVAGILLNRRLNGECVSAEIMEIGILKEHRDKGYGTKLLKEIEKYCKEQKVYVLGAFTYAGDYTTISYYGKNGLTPVAVIPDINGPDNEGQVYMRKILK
jgi:GNAT superfamily N-acetyltransferase